MSTNALIKVEGFKHAELYKHWDGAPKNTLKWLQDFNARISQESVSSEEKFAQLVRSSAMDCEEYNLDPSKFTGWGVVPANKYGFDYLYVLKKDGTVVVK